MALAIDGSTPVLATNAVGTTATVTTVSFTPPAGALLLVLWAGNSALGVSPASPSITDNLGVHLTYTLLDWQSRASTPTRDGQAAIWWAVVGSSAAMTVTVTNGAASGARESALRVVVITGQHATPIGTHNKTGSTGAASIAQNFTGTASSSWGFLADCDWDLKGTQTAGTGCTLLSAGSVASAISYGFVRRTTADGTNGGATAMNATLPGSSTNLGWCWAEVVPAATSTAVWLPGQVTTRRRVVPRRPRPAPSPVPTQVVVPSPVKAPDLRRRVQRIALLRRSRPTVPPPATERPPAQPRRRPVIWRGRPSSVTPVPPQIVPLPPVYPPAALRPRRVLAFRRRAGAPAPVPAQTAAPAAPVYPPWIGRARRVAIARRRPAPPVPPPDQTPAPVPTRSRRAVLRRDRRLGGRAPVPAQVAAPTGPVNPGWWIRSRRVVTGRGHRGAPSPVPAQAVPPAAPALPLWATRPHRIVTALRRGRTVTPVPPQTTPPAAPPLVPQLRTPRRALLGLRRRPPVLPAPVVAPPPASSRHRAATPPRRRPATPRPIPAAPVVPAPAYPRQPLRHRILALLLRRPGRLRFPEQPGAPVIGAVDGYARPGEGRGLSAGPGVAQESGRAAPGSPAPAQAAGAGSSTPPGWAGPGDGSTTNARGG